MNLKSAIHHLLNDSQAVAARGIRGGLVLLILLSAGVAILQLLQPEIFGAWTAFVEQFEWIVLGIFTVELLLRWWSAPEQRQFWNSATTWIDIISIVPFYFGITNLVALRIFRVFRIFKLSRKSLLDFFDKPESQAALYTRFGIIGLIVVSAGLALGELIVPDWFISYQPQIVMFEYIALIIFTVEFFARLFASSSMTNFFSRSANWIDFMAIAPFYVGIDNAVILRLFRILRLFKLFESVSLLQGSSVFNFKQSILRIVTPLIVIFASVKIFIWMMEDRGLWFPETDFGTLFTIIGFALGVVLSQKIGKSFSKYNTVHDMMYKLHGKIMAMQENLNIMKPGAGDAMMYRYLSRFMDIYDGNQDGAVKEIRQLNRDTYREAAAIGNTEHIPFHRLAAMLSALFELTIMIQCERANRTPVTYNLLLQQTIIMYLVLLVVFVPGIKGLISVVFAGYLLYGLFQVTNDFDNVTGKEDDGNLIVVDAVRIRNYLDELEETNKGTMSHGA